jgi:hypothetical protein
LAAAGNRELAASATQIHHQRGGAVHAQVGDETQMDEAGFFQAGNNFYFPTGSGSYPLQKRLGISRVSQRAGGDNPNRIGDHLLCGPMKPSQYLYRFGDRFGSKKAGTKYAFAQARHFTVFVNGAKPAPCQACDLQANGIGTDINRGKSRHEARPTVYMPNKNWTDKFIASNIRVGRSDPKPWLIYVRLRPVWGGVIIGRPDCIESSSGRGNNTIGYEGKRAGTRPGLAANS